MSQQGQPRIGAIVLAAGASQRMGSNKSLLPIGGKPMLLGIVESLPESIRPVVVVTGHERGAIEKLLDPLKPRVELIYNADHQNGGMLSSVKAGLSALRGRADAVFMVLGDQPLVKPATLQLLESKWRDSHALAVRPIFQGKHGHPIILDARSIASILALPPDATLNTFVATNSADLVLDDPATVYDIDTPADYQAITSHPSPREP